MTVHGHSEDVDPTVIRGELGDSVFDRLLDLADDSPPIRPQAEPREGDRYEVREELGRGGMGVVYSCGDTQLGRPVAMKVLRDTLQGRQRAEARFVEEAQIGGQLQHPGIAPVHEVGRRGAGELYFTMKLVQGRTLHELLRERRTPGEDRRRFLDAFETVCQTMAYAHARGVIHRDLKPSNVMVGAFGEVHVMDWGLAKVIGSEEDDAVTTVRDADAAASLDGSVIGTPAYMPPEQARGELERIGTAADVFALGGILLEILTGTPTFPGDSGDASKRARNDDLGDALARLAAVEDDPALVQLARDCLAVDPAGRPGDAGEVARRLGAHLASVEERARVAALEAARQRGRAERERRARWLAILLGITVLTAVVVVAFVLRQREAEERSRRERAEGQVVAALEDASRLTERARQGATEDLEPWEAARQAVERARSLASPDVSNELQVRVARARTAVDDGLRVATDAARARDRREALREDLKRAEIAALRVRDAKERPRTLATGIAGVMEQHVGFDVLSHSPQSAVRALQAAGADASYASVLDRWALALYSVSAEDPSATDRALHLLAVADGLDDNEASSRVRAAAQDPAIDLRALLLESETTPLPESAQLLLAALLEVRGHLGEAATAYRICQARHPGSVLPNLQLGEFLGQLHERAPTHGLDVEALHYLTAATALDPDSALAWAKLGLSHLRRGDAARAVQPLTNASRLQPEWSGLRADLARALFEAGRRKEAIPVLQQVAEELPEHGPTRRNLGLALLREGRLQEAIAPLREAVRLLPEDVRALDALGQALGRTGSPAEAVPLHARARELSPDDPDVGTNYAMALRNSGKVEEAIALWQAVLAEHPEHFTSLYNLGATLADHGRTADALAILERALRLKPDSQQLQSALDLLRERLRKE